jgi:hypothetical protein
MTPTPPLSSGKTVDPPSVGSFVYIHGLTFCVGGTRNSGPTEGSSTAGNVERPTRSAGTS